MAGTRPRSLAGGFRIKRPQPLLRRDEAGRHRDSTGAAEHVEQDDFALRRRHALVDPAEAAERPAVDLARGPFLPIRQSLPSTRKGRLGELMSGAVRSSSSTTSTAALFRFAAMS
jgi:hypothetical protein